MTTAYIGLLLISIILIVAVLGYENDIKRKDSIIARQKKTIDELNKDIDALVNDSKGARASAIIVRKNVEARGNALYQSLYGLQQSTLNLFRL